MANKYTYPAIGAWHTSSLPYYIKDLKGQAQEEEAPHDAIYKRQDGAWATIREVKGAGRRETLYRNSGLPNPEATPARATASTGDKITVRLSLEELSLLGDAVFRSMEHKERQAAMTNCESSKKAHTRKAKACEKLWQDLGAPKMTDSDFAALARNEAGDILGDLQMLILHMTYDQKHRLCGDDFTRADDYAEEGRILVAEAEEEFSEPRYTKKQVIDMLMRDAGLPYEKALAQYEATHAAKEK